MKQLLLMFFIALGVVTEAQQVTVVGNNSARSRTVTSYELYSSGGQLVLSGTSEQIDFPKLQNGIYFLKLGPETIRIVAQDGVLKFTQPTETNMQLTPLSKNPLPDTNTGEDDGKGGTTNNQTQVAGVQYMLDSMDLSEITTGGRSIPSFTYCDSIDLARRDLPPLQDAINYFFEKADSLTYDWQKYELAATFIYRICDFKGSTPSAAIDGATWAAMTFEQKYQFCQADSGNLLCWYRAKMLEQFLNQYLGANDMVIIQYLGIHTFLVANTSAGAWMLDAYFANSFFYEADATYVTQYVPASQRPKYYPNFIALLRLENDRPELIKVRNIPRIFGSADNLKDAIPVLQYPCTVVKQFLDTVTVNPFCDTCFGYNIAEWMPSHFFLTDLSSQLNLKELDKTNYADFAANPANLPYGYTGSNLYTYITNGVDLTPSVYATSQWPTQTIIEIKKILGIP